LRSTSAASGCPTSPRTATTPACRSPTPWPPITETGWIAWSSPRPPSRACPPTPPLFLPPQLNAKFWHLAFNQLPAEVNEQLVRGREDIFFGAEFAASAGTNKLPDDAVKYYIDILRSGPDALRGSFELYRAFPTIIAQNQQRKARRLTLPVLAIGGAERGGEGVAGTMKLVADDVQGVVLAGTGHWVAEQAPEELLAALTAFLAPTRLGFSHERRPALGTTWPAAHRRAGARGLRRRLQLERRHRAVAAAGLHRRRPGQPAARPGPDSAYIASVVNQIDGPVLLVGHSYGGAVITSAAATATGVVGLVFVAAFAPDEGERRQRRRPFHGPARGCRHRRGRGLARDHGLPAAGGDEPDLQGGAHPDRSPGTAAMTTRGRDGC
jgi:pimeloyl-ACP methyl ester carboxylesterase